VSAGNGKVDLACGCKINGELETEVLMHAATTAVDSTEANLEYGEIVRAVREGVLSDERVRELGQLLADPKPLRRMEDDITVAKLVGIGVQI
jgi:ornithine cyclodeaminase/alanine dehydrogenase-like protein (mu-crystallin family)